VEIMGDWGKCMTKSSWFYFLTRCYYGDEIKVDEMSRACHTHGEGAKCIQDLIKKYEGRRPLEEPRCMWETNIKMHLNSNITCGRGLEAYGIVKCWGTLMLSRQILHLGAGWSVWMKWIPNIGSFYSTQ